MDINIDGDIPKSRALWRCIKLAVMRMIWIEGIIGFSKERRKKRSDYGKESDLWHRYGLQIPNHLSIVGWNTLNLIARL